VRIVSLLAITWNSETGQIAWPGESFAPRQAQRMESRGTAEYEVYEVDVLGAAQQFARFRAEIVKMPEIRRDRVAELRDAFESEKYFVSSRQIADAMLGDFPSDIGNVEP